MADWHADRRDWLPDDPEHASRPPGATSDRQPRRIVPEYVCILFVRNHCPHCGSPRSRADHVVRTPTRVFRYHRCRGCGRRYKSIEDLGPRALEKSP